LRGRGWDRLRSPAPLRCRCCTLLHWLYSRGMDDFGVMMPFILGTEFMMPLGDQKWLEPASRMVSKSGLAVLGTFFAGTRPGALRPGT